MTITIPLEPLAVFLLAVLMSFQTAVFVGSMMSDLPVDYVDWVVGFGWFWWAFLLVGVTL